MSSKKKTPTSLRTNPPTIQIGSRVRCTDDGVEGRIVWANAVSVKIRWNDGEQVTWRRDSLAGRPIDILAEPSDEDQAADASAPTDPLEPSPQESAAAPSARQSELSAQPSDAEAPTEPLTMEPALAEPPATVGNLESTAVPESVALEQPPATDAPTAVAASAEIAQQTSTTPEDALGQPASDSATAKRPRTRQRKPAADGQTKRLSALDAAALVLAEAGHDVLGDDRGHGAEGLLDIARRQDAAGNIVFGTAQRDHHQGQPQPLRQDPTRQVCS